MKIEGPGLNPVGDLRELEVGMFWEIGPKAVREGVDDWLFCEARGTGRVEEGMEIDEDQHEFRTIEAAIGGDEAGVDTLCGNAEKVDRTEEVG